VVVSFYSGLVTEQQVAATATMHAPAQRIFDLLADPAKHPLIDGSGTVRHARITGPARLGLGSTFGMDMRMGLSYRVTNRVVEYEEGTLIAWRHFAGHRWRWELSAVDDNTTEVTETFDWSTAPMGFLYPVIGFPQRNLDGIRQTLGKLDSVLAAN
jgi:uncharacterized protein YndB with AHSA1/START domain